MSVVSIYTILLKLFMSVFNALPSLSPSNPLAFG